MWIRSLLLFPLKIIHGDQNLEDKQDLQTVDTPKYNFNSFINDSTKQLYQRRLDEKLREIERQTFSDIYENIIASLHQASKETFGTQQNKISNEIWWNEEIEYMVKQKKEQHLNWLNTKNTEDHQTYKETDRQLRKMIKQ
ncbi:unnamed protein product [Diabrotica balteata]|uniref:Uncharacterized protein n=1 Tax=Diabrotica balteata TaxID=107213 RepID=A0A9N9T0Y2_DIABA|nr:unnamed protein product [Diabrotica balteata]